MDNYIKISTSEVLTECDFYALIRTNCGYKCNKGWQWQNQTTLVIKTAQNWVTYFRNNPPNCTCSDPLCPNGREITYLNMIEDVLCTGMGLTDLTVTLNAVNYIGAGVQNYIISWGDGSPTESIVISTPLTHDVSALANNTYKGFISFEGASFNFWYTTRFGVITTLQTQRTTTLNVDLSCGVYPNYTITVNEHCEVLGSFISTAEIKIFENTVYSDVINAILYDIEGVLVTDFNVGTNLIVTEYTNLVPMIIQNIFLLECGCI